MKKRLVLILNGKGGVGKSFFAVNFIQYLKDRPFPHVAFDSDNENSTLKRFHPEAGFLNLASPRGLDPMIQSLDGSNLVVVDCRAASTDLFLDFFTSTDLSNLLAGLDAGLTLAMPVGAELDSIEQIQRLIHELADRCQYVVIRNAVHNDTFALFEASKVRHRLTTELGAKEISMSRMQNWLVDGLNRNNLTPTTARNSPEFYLLDRQRLIMWQRRLYEQIDSAVDLSRQFLLHQVFDSRERVGRGLLRHLHAKRSRIFGLCRHEGETRGERGSRRRGGLRPGL